MLTWVQQFHQTQEHIEKLEPLLLASKGTMQISRWNGAAEFLAERAEDFVEFMKCVYGAGQLVGMFHDFLFHHQGHFYLFLAILKHKLTDILYCTGCGTRFVDLVEGYEIMAGYDNLIFGRGVPGCGTDGILEADGRLMKNKRSEQMGSANY
jgi:hypothetical protein